MSVPPLLGLVVLWSGSCLIQSLEEGFREFYGELMFLGGYRYGLFPDGDHNRVG